MGGIPTPEASRAIAEAAQRHDDLRAYCYRTAERAANWLAEQIGAARSWSQLMDVERDALAWDVAKRLGIDRALWAEPVPEPRR